MLISFLIAKIPQLFTTKTSMMYTLGAHPLTLGRFV